MTYNGEVALEVSVWDYEAHQQVNLKPLQLPWQSILQLGT